MGQAKNLMPVIIAVSMVSAIGGLVFNTMPLLLGAAGKEFGFTPEKLGSLSSNAGWGYLIGTITAPFWVDRVNWKLAAFLFASFAIGTFLFISQAPPTSMIWSFAVYGFACALAIGLATRVLADMPDLERAYGTRLSVELWSIAAFLYVLPVYFIAKNGFAGAMIGMAIFTGLLGLGAFLFPKRETTSDKISYPKWSDASRAWIMIGLFLIYLLVNVALFFFLAVIAEGFNPSEKEIGLMFLVLKWLGGGAGAVGAIIGMRAGFKLPHFLALAILLIGVAGLWLAPNFKVFMVSSWVWEFGFTLGCLYATTAITRFDPSKKLVVLVPATFGISMVLGGVIGGRLLGSGGAAPLYLAVAIGGVLPALYIFLSRNNHNEMAVNDA